LSFRQQPINETNLILFGQALLKAINTLHRQKTSRSANLDTSVASSPSASTMRISTARVFSCSGRMTGYSKVLSPSQFAAPTR
jgi:hypothetical protein